MRLILKMTAEQIPPTGTCPLQEIWPEKAMLPEEMEIGKSKKTIEMAGSCVWHLNQN